MIFMNKTEIKLVALDLDDTLLNRKKEVSEKAFEVAQKAREKGIELMPVTGRPFYGIPEPVFRALKPRFVVSMNGAVVTDGFGKAIDGVQCEVTLEEKDKDFVMELARQTQTAVEFFTGNYSYETEEVCKDRMETFKGTVLEEYINTTRRSVKDIYSFAKENSAQEIALMAKDEKDKESLMQSLAPLNLKVIPYGNYIEVTAFGADKGQGILKIAGLMGIRKEQVLVIGDSENDLPMLSLGGVVSVAMGNACHKVKKAARFATKDCDKDGAAYAIQKFALGEKPYLFKLLNLVR